MALTVEMYGRAARDSMGSEKEMPDAETYLGILATPGTSTFHPDCTLIGVTSDADDLVAIGPQGSEGTPEIPVFTNVTRWWGVPRNKGWSITI